jgi:hypothetical protein
MRRQRCNAARQNAEDDSDEEREASQTAPLPSIAAASRTAILIIALPSPALLID